MDLCRFLRWLGMALVVLLGTQAPAAVAADTGRQLFRAYDDEDGLRNLVIRSLLQDREGLLWVGTENGLYLYDGFSFRRTSVSDGRLDPAIGGLIEDSTGRMWVATGDAVLIEDGIDRWRIVMTSDWIEGDALAAGPDGTVFVRSIEGLFQLRLNGDSVERTAIDHMIEAVPEPSADREQALRPLFVDRDGSLWTGCGVAICQRSVRGSVVRWGESRGVPPDEWREWHQLHDGTLWVRSFQNLLYKRPSDEQFTELPLAPDTRRKQRTIVIGSTVHGSLLTSRSKGLAEWNGERWDTHEDDGLPAYTVSALLTDAEGSLWIGTYGHGLFRALGFNAWRHWTVDDELPSGLVWTFKRDGAGRLWILTDEGPAVLEGSKGLTRPVQPDGAPLHLAYAMDADRAGNVWIAAADGRLLRYGSPDRAPQSIDTGLTPNRMTLVEDDRMWLAAEEGLFEFDPRQPNPTPRRVTGARDIERPSDLFNGPSGAKWVVAENGLFTLDGSNWRRVTATSGESLERFKNGAMDRNGTLWLGSFGEGLLHLNIVDGQAVILDRIGSETLDTRSILFTRFDRRGWLWVGTDVGVAVYDGSSWRRIDRDDGLLWNDCNEGAFLADDDGSVWIGTSSGASHFLHPESLSSPPPPTVILHGVRIGDEDLLVSADRRFDATGADLTVNLATSSFSVERTLQLAYRLVGLDDEWQVASSPVLRYHHLSPGHYSFEARAYTLGGSQTSDTVTVAFDIDAPLWRRPLAFGIAIALIATLTYLAFRIRTRMLVRRSQALQKLVDERTAELEAEKAELMRIREALTERATRDALTGLWNRGFVLEQLNTAIRRSETEGRPLAVALIDIDHFKNINDTQGHLIGDEVLRQFGQRLTQRLTGDEMLGRYGGEEFLLVLPDLPDTRPSARLDELHQTLCDRRLHIKGVSLIVTASFGVAWHVPGGGDADRLLQRADAALYRAKAEGRACIRYA